MADPLCPENLDGDADLGRASPLSGVYGAPEPGSLRPLERPLVVLELERMAGSRASREVDPDHTLALGPRLNECEKDIRGLPVEAAEDDSRAPAGTRQGRVDGGFPVYPVVELGREANLQSGDAFGGGGVTSQP